MEEPRKKIDYVLVSNGAVFEVIDSEVLEGIELSDHLPMVSEISLTYDVK
ncbi:endonuclease/exonuclease/phosphatase family protein [Echinicola sediminis]